MTTKAKRSLFWAVTFFLLASSTYGQILMKGTTVASKKETLERGGGCSLSGVAAGEMQPQLIPIEMVMRPDQQAVARNMAVFLNGLMHVTPKLYMYNDSNSPNASATPKVFDPRFPDGTVMFGVNLFRSEIMNTGNVNFTFAAILAHEFAHILQFKMGEELPTKQKELEADYMAGWYMGNSSGVWIGQASSQALQSFYSKGDYEFNSRDHHGTPEERVRAVQAGLKDAGSPLRLAFSHAHKYVGAD